MIPSRQGIPAIAVWLLLAVRLLLGLAYSSAIPLGEAPDEADHLAYATYIAQEHRLPDGVWMTQAKHPPLYHALAAFVTGPVGLDTHFLRANPDIGFTPDASPNFFIHTASEGWPWRAGPLAMRLARLLSVLAGVGLVAATYALGRAIWPGWPTGALAAAAFVTFLPESLFVGGAMSNDTLAALLATMALWASLRSRKLWHAVLTGVLMGLGLWAKVSVAALWPVVCLALVVRGWEDGRRPPGDGRPATDDRRPRFLRWQIWIPAVVAGGVALLITAPWFLRNRQLYGDWMGWPLVLATIDRRQGAFGLGELAWLARGLFLSFWGKFGGAGQIALPVPFYVFWGGLAGASALGWLRKIANRKSQISVARNSGYLQSVMVLLAAPLILFVWLISYSQIALGTDQGRLLFPAIGPLALLLVGGLAGVNRKLQIADCRLASQHDRRPVSAGLVAWCGLLFAVALLALVWGLWLPFAPPPAPTTTELSTAQPVAQQFGDQIELVGYQWAPTQADSRQLSLFWRAVRPIETDLRTALRLVDAQGAVIWEWKRSPGAGRFSTDRWPVERLVADSYAVPAKLLGQASRVEIGVRPFPEGLWLDVKGGSFLVLPRPTP